MALKIEGRRIFLRPLKQEDAKNIYNNAKSREVSEYNTLPYPYQIEDAVRFIKHARTRLRKKLTYELGIALKEEGIIGIVSLINFDIASKNAEIGYWLGKNYWRQGLGTEALNLLLKFGFDKLKLERIYARVRHPNIASAQLLLKSGFTLEGRLRKAKFDKGKWYDHLIYSILKKEFASKN